MFASIALGLTVLDSALRLDATPADPDLGPRGKPSRTESVTEAARKGWTLIAAILGLNITILRETVVFWPLPAINRDLHVVKGGTAPSAFRRPSVDVVQAA